MDTLTNSHCNGESLSLSSNNNNSFLLIGSKKREILVKLNKIDIHKCERCPQLFHNVLLLEKHIAHHDELFRKHMFSAKVVLQRAKIYTCKQCKQSFLTNRECVLHKLKHIQHNVKVARALKKKPKDGFIDKPYNCPDCEYSFAAETNLEAHSVLHKPFPHICTCGIGYYRKQDLLSHVNIVHKTRDKKPWKPKIKFMGFFENKMKTEPDTYVNRKGPKLKAELLFKCPLIKKPTKKPQAAFDGKLLVEKEKRQFVTNTRYPKGTKTFMNKRGIRNTLDHPDIKIELSADNMFICPVCNKQLASKSGLYTHYRTHTGERPYRCEICDASFNQTAGLTTHINNVHIGKRNFTCRYCPKAFKNAGSLRLHERTHTGEKPYECSYCNKAFSDPSALARHLRIHTKDKRYKCPYCPKAFTDAGSLIRHRKRHNKQKNFSCTQCERQFYERGAMDKHMAVHSDVKTFCCDHCGKYFALKVYLVGHIKTVHMKIKRYACKYCPVMYTNAHSIQSHLAQNHNRYEKMVKKFECDDCTMRFLLKRELYRHVVKSHIGIRCKGCWAYFASRFDFKRHKIVGSCAICDKKLLCKSAQSRHLKKHKAEIKHECDVCGQLFEDELGLNRHLESPSVHMQMSAITAVAEEIKHESGCAEELNSKACLCLRKDQSQVPIEE